SLTPAPVLTLATHPAPETGEPEARSLPETPPETRTTPQNAAYVIYTSGSTGKPKGVCVEHRAAVRLFSTTGPLFGFDETDVWTLFHSFAFDFSVWEVFGALLHGGRLVIVPRVVTRDPGAFADLMLREGVTVLNQTPSAFQQLTAHCARQPVPPAFALRHVIFGGEALNWAALAPWFAAYGDRQPKLVNMYGITETTVHVTHLELSADPGRPADIGVALPDLQIRLLDTGLQPVPPGIPGEICVAGPGVTRGYLNRADLTADRFVPDPWGAPGSRMYRSGDVARQRADGGFDYVGRADAQVKLRGFRIETGEIEAALAALPGIAAACVRLRGDRLVAWLASGTPQEPLALRMALARDLPDYMLPAAFVVLPDLPLTTNGKVNVAALPDPEPAAAEPGFVPPEGAAEQALAAIWAEVLGRESVGALDNFFASGGDSMRAVTLAARAAEAGLPVTVEAIFRHQTLRGLAGAVGRAAPVAAYLPPADLPAHLETAWPMTRLQLGMLFHGEVAAEAAVYHDVFSFRLNLGWDEPAFRAALGALAVRHPVLRSSFDLHGADGPMQQVHREVALPLVVSDLSGMAEPDAEAAIAADIAAEKARPFAISAPPLLRLMMHLRGAADVQITLGFHHAILDGWSVAAMQVELMQLWQQARAGQIAGLPPLAATPALAAVAEQAALRAPGARAFWAALLEDAEVLRLPPPAPDAPPGRVGLRFGPEVLADLRALADRLGLPLRSLLLTAHLKMLALWGGTADVVSGLVTHTRPEARDAEKMLGLFLNTLPVRLRLGQESWQDLARATFAAEVDLAAHRHYPLAAIVEANGHVPPFDVMFNFIHFHVQDALAGMAGVDGTPALRGMTAFEATNFALGVHAVLGGDGLVVDFAHDPARLDAGLAGRMAESYGAILRAMLADPAAPHRVAALIPAEDRALLARWNRTETRYPQAGQTLVGIIEDRIAAEGDRTALRFGGESLGFAALNARANRLAHALRARGVGPDSRVGLAVDRSFEMMVAVLAILKAGGAWVPLPPDYPPARLAMILEDAAPVLVLAQPHLADLPGVEVMLIGPEHAPQDMPDHNPEPLAGPEDTAYVIFTSGSTGRPKGVAVPHRAIVNRLLWMAAAYDLGPGDRVLQKTPLGFDVSVWELILPLMTGAVMVIAEPEGHRDPAYLERVIRDEAVTALHFVPPMLEAFLDRAAPRALPSLRCVVCSGQALPRATQATFHRAHPGVGLHNLYGPTEAAVDVTAWTCAPGDAGDKVPIGHAIANVRMYVLDAALDPVPPGVAGHLYIGGVALARGYVGRPDLTAAVFLPDPFGPPGARMYRTGDLARFRPDGALDYLGRADDQVKIRGFRVEPGEVEAALRAAGADQAVVLAAPGLDGTMRLLAWVAGDAPPDTLRAALARHLPAHMLPEAITPLAALPVTANGKADRKALPMPETAPAAPRIAPRSPSEATIAAIWARLLGQPQVGVTDSFFAIGGHSILALRLLAELQRETGVVLSLRLFLADPTVAGLAVAMDALTGLTAPPEDDTAETETILL
ncbi:non-ribosomal peptide synthetase, partial [Gemmobacter lutimaris]|uniref:non-ribosomal peptide synthetase n=1 Tax=Gemmobacter lutimaris TaxID=2306023 RepID=UPI0011C369B1